MYVKRVWSRTPSPSSSIPQLVTPQSVKDIQRFWGFANFYRPFIQIFSNTATPQMLVVKRIKNIKSKKSQSHPKRRIIMQNSPLYENSKTTSPKKTQMVSLSSVSRRLAFLAFWVLPNPSVCLPECFLIIIWTIPLQLSLHCLKAQKKKSWRWISVAKNRFYMFHGLCYVLNHSVWRSKR